MKEGTNPAPRTVCLDFDGVLADYHGWRGDAELDVPMSGAIEFVERTISAGYVVVVHTTRNPSRIRQWLSDNGFPPCDVSRNKPKAKVYIDDRGFRFDKNWDAAFAAIEQRTHWEGKE